MYRTLIPVDDSEQRALAQAKYVASLPDAPGEVEGILLHIFTGDGEGDGFPRTATRVASVRRAQEHLEERGVDVTVVEDSQETVDNILRHADEHDVDSIVLGGRKRSPTGKALFGSVTQSVILNSTRPVVVVGSQLEDTDDE